MKKLLFSAAIIAAMLLTAAGQEASAQSRSKVRNQHVVEKGQTETFSVKRTKLPETYSPSGAPIGGVIKVHHTPQIQNFPQGVKLVAMEDKNDLHVFRYNRTGKPNHDCSFIAAQLRKNGIATKFEAHPADNFMVIMTSATQQQLLTAINVAEGKLQQIYATSTNPERDIELQCK